jgi:hypothetical protein
MFKGLLNNTNAGFHSYSTDDLACNNLGIVSFSKDAVNEFLSDESVYNLAKQSFKCTHSFDAQDIRDIQNKITGNESETISYYFLFNQETGSYEKKDYNKNLTELVDAHDASQIADTINAANQDKLNIIKDVQKSLHGCIHFYPFGNSGPLYKLHFQNRQKRNNSRDLAINGDPKISAIPRIPTGRKYHFGLTEEQKDKDNIGFYKVQNKSKFSIDQDDQSAKVAAKLRLSYNEGLGYFESGTQVILARLIQDIDPAPIPQIDMNNIDNLSSSDLYNPDSLYYTSAFTTGFAIPMTVHNGNPHTFGPNIIDKTSFKKEKIRVVNRAAKSFKQNDVVLCMLIDNEWILIDFGEQTLEPPGLKFGKWSFKKMMVNSDSFLLDDNYYKTGDGGGYEILVFGDAYASRMKVMFYRDLNNLFADEALSMDGINDINLLAKLNASPSVSLENVNIAEADFPENIDDIQFTPSTKYMETTSFDMVGSHMGGTNQLGNIIGRNNRVIPNGSEAPSVAEVMSEIGLWWGPLFPEGFASSRTLAINDKNIDVQYNGLTSFFGSDPSLNITSSDYDQSTTGGMFDDDFDFNFYQLPADIALNASPFGVNGSPIESLRILSDIESTTDNFAIAYNQYRYSNERYSWISVAGDGSSFYDLEPVTKNKLQIIPLSWAMVENSGDAFSVLDSGINKYDQIFGAMKDREGLIVPDGYTSPIPWDQQVQQKPRSMPLGVPVGSPFDIDEDPRGEAYEGSNLLGITAGKNTIKVGGGASVQFDANYNLGLPKFTSVTGGQVSPISILPIGGGFAFGGGSNAIRTYGFPQWGSQSTILPDVWGGSTLRAKIYDHWPDEDTIYDVRYFQPLHFTSGKLATFAESSLIDEGVKADIDDWIPSSQSTSSLVAIKYERTVDTISYDVDFRVPTFGNPLEPDLDNQIVSVGQLINSRGVASGPSDEETLAILRPYEEWRVNTVCRGMMVNENFGFRHLRRVIGINSSNYTIIEGGTNFVSEAEFKNLGKANSVKIKITEAEAGSIKSFEVIEQGEGYLPSDFSISFADPQNPENTLYGAPIRINDAVILFHTGIVYDKLYETNYPKKHGEVNCLPKSNGEDGVLYGSKSTTIGITNPNASNLYDLFLFYANDVGHVDLVPLSQTAGYTQYVDLDIGAG